jgi:hypothetical protein
MTNGTLAPPWQLNTDRFVIRAAVTALRNAFTQIAKRQPMAFGPGERRAAARIELQIPVHLTAALVKRNDVWNEMGFGSSIRATCVDISLTGVGLSHATPLASGFAIVRFDIPAEQAICLVVEFAWTNVAGDGSCTSGARILGVIDVTIDNSAPFPSG